MSKPTCSVDDCDRPPSSRGWCKAHYSRWQRYGDVRAEQPIGERYEPGTLCSVENCDQPVSARSWCKQHYRRWRLRGRVDPEEAIRSKAPNGTGHVNTLGYRVVYHNGRHVLEHRLIMERVLCRPLADFEDVHHKNGIRHDNHPENLELWVVPQPRGQRAADLALWVIDTYPELLNAHRAEASISARGPDSYQENSHVRRFES